MRTPGVASQLASRAAGVRADVTFLLVDALLSIAAYALVLLVSTDISQEHTDRLALFAGSAVAAHLGANAAFGLYGRMWRHASVSEARHTVVAGMVAAAVLAALTLVGLLDIPLALVVLGPAVATFLLGASRFRSRLFAWQRPRTDGGTQRALVIGARDAGASLVRDLQGMSAGLLPVAVVDDDPASHGLLIHGIPVVGGIADIPAIATKFGVSVALLAYSSAPSSLVRAVADQADAAGIALRILPGLGERVHGIPAARQLRHVRIEDLLGRQEIRTDRAAVRRLVAGRRVLVTGGGGSIGSELVRQLADFEPAQLVIVDHDETHLFDSAARVREALGARCVEALVDIRDRVDVLGLFSRHEPEIVFHAAAHKHVPMLERFPVEAARTNVLGTANVVDAAAAVGVSRFVFISSDKAVRPQSVLGVTKWLGEQLVAERAEETGAYCCVRFGNVLGSRGSVVPTFQRQIAAGGPVTVTSPDMTRYFMSVEEAVQLVLQAAVLTERKDLFMLEMGQPVVIADLAKAMIELAGHSLDEIAISYSGVRPGEKLAEDLCTPNEEIRPTEHPSISRLIPSIVPRPILEDGLHLLRRAVAQRDSAAARDVMFSLNRWVDDADLVLEIDLTDGSPSVRSIIGESAAPELMPWTS